jgi:hypothetical protein
VNNSSQESVSFGGSSGFMTSAGYQPGLNSGNALGDLLLSGTVYGTGELRTNPNVQQRWHDIEFYVADSWKLDPRWTVDFGLRFSHMEPPFMKDDAMGNFVLENVNPSLGNSSCNGIEYPPGTNPCPGLGVPGGSDGPNRSLVPIKFLWIAPRLGVAWDVYGNGKMAIRAGLGRFYQRDRVSPGLGVGTSPPFSGTASVTRTLDSPNPVTGAGAVGYGAPSNALEQEEANSNYWQWNVAVERELVPNTVLEVAYVGSKGLDLFGQTNLNEIAPQNRLAYAQTGNAALRPLANTAIGDGTMALWQHNRESIYHALQTALRVRFWRDSVVQLNYTWSKLLANTGVANADGPGLSNNNAYTDSTQPDLEWSRGANDVTHSFNANMILGLPTFEEKGPFVKHVFGDWQFGTIVQASTGYPLTVATGNVPGLSGNGGASGTGHNSGSLSRPNYVVGQPCHVETGDETQWLNPAAWTLNGYQIGTNGTAGRNICDGPSLLQVDASLYKNIRLSGRVRLQLRFEVFNVFNRANFLGTGITNGGQLSTYNPSNVVFDTPTGATATRIISADPATNFGQLTQVRDPRTAQVGLRLSF